jgi:hypothetical protein
VKTLALGLSAVSLVASIVPAVLFFYGQLDLPSVKLWMLVATIVWFGATPIWMKQ